MAHDPELQRLINDLGTNPKGTYGTVEQRLDAIALTTDLTTHEADTSTHGAALVADAAELPFNVKNYGAIGNGIADDTTAIQNTINAASTAGGGIVSLPTGTYIISTTLNLANKVSLCGFGISSTIIKTNVNGAGVTFASWMISGTDVGELTISDLKLEGPSIDASVGSGLRFIRSAASNVPHVILRNLWLTGFAGDGLFMNTPILSTLQNVRVQNCAGHCFNLYGGTSTNLYECYALISTQSGFFLSTMTYTALIGCAAEGNGIGYNLLTSRNISLNACGMEGSMYRSATYPGIAYKLQNGKNNSLISCYSSGFTNATGTDKAHILVDNETKDIVVGFRGTADTTYAPDNTIKLTTNSDVVLINDAFDEEVGSGRSVAVGSTITELMTLNTAQTATAAKTFDAGITIKAGQKLILDGA